MTSFKKESNEDELFDDENDEDDNMIDFNSIHKRSIEIHSRKSMDAGGRILKTETTEEAVNDSYQPRIKASISKT